MSYLSPQVRSRLSSEKQVVIASRDNLATIALPVVTEKGPFDRNVTVRSPGDFTKVFGRRISSGIAAYWNELFWANSQGEGELICRRVAHYTDPDDPSTLTAIKASLTLANTAPGYSLSGSAPATVTSASANTLQVALSGEIAQSITIGSALTSGAAIAAAIQAAVRALTAASGPNQPDYDGFICIFTEDEQYLLINGTASAGKTVVVTDGASNDLAASTKLGTGNGGTQGAALASAITVDALTEGTHGNVVSVTTTAQFGASTTLASVLTDGDQIVHLTSLANIGPGSILQVRDGTATLNDPNPFHIEVDYVRDGYAHLREPVSLTAPVEAGSTAKSLVWKLEVFVSGRSREVFTGLSMNSRDTKNYFINRVNDISAFVTLTDLGAPALDPYRRPAAVSASYLTGGLDGLVGLNDADFIGGVDADGVKTGMQAFRDTPGINWICCPERRTAAVHVAMRSLSEELEDFQFFVDLPAGLDPNSAVSFYEGSGAKSDYGTCAWPNYRVSDPSDPAVAVQVPASAVELGRISWLANTPGATIGTPPGGARYQALGVIGIEDETTIRLEIRDILYPARINPVMRMAATGYFTLGVQTGSGTGFGEIQKVAVLLAVKREVTELIRLRLISDPASIWLLRSLQTQVEAYMNGRMKEGWFATTDPRSAYSVDFGLDSGLNSIESLERGEVYGRVGPALKKAFEFANLEFFERPQSRSGVNS